MDENEITYKIRGGIFEVHKILGAGLLESVYQEALLHELRHQGLHVEREGTPAGKGRQDAPTRQGRSARSAELRRASRNTPVFAEQ